VECRGKPLPAGGDLPDSQAITGLVLFLQKKKMLISFADPSYPASIMVRIFG
jgi:hypothetical protein